MANDERLCKFNVAQHYIKGKLINSHEGVFLPKIEKDLIKDSFIEIEDFVGRLDVEKNYLVCL